MTDEHWMGRPIVRLGDTKATRKAGGRARVIKVGDLWVVYIRR